MEISNCYLPVISIVQEVGQTVFSDDLKSIVNLKGAADFVTAVDYEISTLLKQKLHSIMPGVGFVSEEGGNEEKALRWILDPIDGTTNLVYNYNMCSVSLALCEDNTVNFGIVYNPFNGDLFVAERGKGAYFNGKRMGIAPDRRIEDCIIEFGAGSTKKEHADEIFELAKTVFKSCLDLRRICSSALAISYVAAGKLNGYFEMSLKPWDYAAASLILEECGGKCADWIGKPIQFDKSSSFICGTPQAFHFLLSVIGRHNKS